MDNTTRDAFCGLLQDELVCALGCTEPIALAYAAAVAGRVLGEPCESMTVGCSGNIVKNVKSVAVPNAEGLKGVEVAAALGLLGGDADAALEVLESVTHAHVEHARELIGAGFVQVDLLADVPNLYIDLKAYGADHVARVVVEDRHTNVVLIERDGRTLSQEQVSQVCPQVTLGAHIAQHALEPAEGGGDPHDLLSMAAICDFAREIDLDLVRDLLDRQIDCNAAICAEGLAGHWGSQIGRTILATQPVDVVTRMRARAAAGSDARMGGCSLPVVINSGSGNQGITVSIPVVEYAQTIHADHDQLLRALCISNLTALHLKRFIGSLSAFCGVVCAAAGAGAAVTYLAGGTEAQIGSTVVNTLANVGGIMCDGAKASCAAKIASAVDAAMLGHRMAMLGEDFCAGDGLVADDVETTIVSMGYVGRVGMHPTDVEILNIMLGKTCPDEMRC